MTGKLIKLLIVVVALYLLMKIPYVNNVMNNIKADIFEKRDNVVNEYERVKDKVTQTKQKVDDTVNTVENTVDKVGETVDKVGEAADKVGDLFGGDEEKTDKVTCTEAEKAAEMCTMDYTPVCGDDGATYGNKCQACASKKIETYVPGECVTE